MEHSSQMSFIIGFSCFSVHRELASLRIRRDFKHINMISPFLDIYRAYPEEVNC